MNRLGTTLITIIALFTFACSSSDDGIGVEFIFIDVDKTIILAGSDEIVITADVRDGDFNTLEGVEVDFYANDILLDGNVFRPSERGNYTITAQYRNIESDTKEVRAVTLEDDIEELILKYDGYPYLTTNPWSISGIFTYEGRIADLLFSLPKENIQLSLDDEVVTQQGEFLFNEAATHEFKAQFGGLSSNTIQIEVREEKVLQEVTIPVIFHAYGDDIDQSDIRKFVDTLNGAFSKQSYNVEEVKAGLINPNAVNCYIKFEAVTQAPAGKILAGPGFSIIPPTDGEYPLLNLEQFRDVEAQYGYDPEEYLNIWIGAAWDFEFPVVNKAEIGGNGARGLAYSPFLVDVSLPGLPTFGANPKDPDPNTLSHSVLVRSGSVLGSHPDYIVNRVAYFLGLFDTISFGCLEEGDQCKDTFSPDFSQPSFPLSEFTACEGGRFFTNNHMSIGRRYNNFTYDQRERMHVVLEHAMFRPGR